MKIPTHTNQGVNINPYHISWPETFLLFCIGMYCLSHCSLISCVQSPPISLTFKGRHHFQKVKLQLISTYTRTIQTTPTSTPYRKIFIYTFLIQGVTSVTSFYWIFWLAESSSMLILIGCCNNSLQFETERDPLRLTLLWCEQWKIKFVVLGILLEFLEEPSLWL